MIGCKFFENIGQGIWIGELDGRYSCIIPYCKKYNRLCGKQYEKEGCYDD